ncbi:ABC transporter ATP-binding protein [Candidatus Dojkabacteria bacterium]|jgi:ABC-2 type transport system ATP-binding protein|nr:ABC transporter ATP-binding protein [Candidatus Dojkabacteria bacterium]
MISIEISNLKKYFGTVKAVDDISLNIEKGEIFGFLGPNGAGKTTTIGCLLKLLKPDSGSIIINGKDSWEDDVEIKKTLGFIPTDPYFYPNWTGKEHIEFVKSIKGETSLLSDLVKDFSFNPKIKVGKLSTGNKQKLSIIIAMMHRPKILVMDEPTRGLDPLLQNLFYKYLRNLNKEGCTIFMSSHNLPEVESICSKVAIIRNGKIVETGDIKNLQSKRTHMITIELNAGQKFPKELLKNFNAQVVNNYGNILELKMAGDINPLLREIVKIGLKDITISKANLEDIFLESYK